MNLGDLFMEAAGKIAAAAGKSGAEVDDQLHAIAERLEPDFNEALLSSDPNATNFVADRAAAAVAQELSGQLADLKDQLSVVASFIIKAAIIGAAG